MQTQRQSKQLSFISNLVRRPDYRKGFLFFKRTIKQEVLVTSKRFHEHRDNIERLLRLREGDIQESYKIQIVADLANQKMQLDNTKDRLAFYGLCNSLSYEAYVINILFHDSWLLENVIEEGKNMSFSWKGTVYFSMYGKVYVPKAKIGKDGKPKLLVDKGKTWQNRNRLIEEGKELFSVDNPNGEKYFSYIDKPKPFLHIRYYNKATAALSKYVLKPIKFVTNSKTIATLDLNALTRFYQATQANPDLALKYNIHERKVK